MHITMKVKDFIKLDGDTDVYDNVTEELGIAFCGPMEMTEEGAAYFETALNLDITIDTSGKFTTATVNCEDEFFPELWKYNLKKASEFFYAAAGYCDADDYDRWFKEID